MREQSSPVARDSHARLEALRRLRILDTDYEPHFDRIVRMVASFFEAPSVGIHLLDDERQWVKAFEGQRFSCARGDSICQFTLSHDDLLVIPDLSVDARTRDLGIVTGDPHVRFYAGMPLRTSEGHAVGTLCLMAYEPRAMFDASEESWLRQFAELVIETMELRVDYNRSKQDLRRAIEFDAATGLRNRSTLIRHAQLLLEGTRAPAGVAAIKIELGRMDMVVGATGQIGISAVLRAAAERLEAMIGPDDLLGTGDGNTFLILNVRHVQPDGRELEAWLDATARKALLRLAEPMDVKGHQINITASIGLAAFTDGSPVYYAVDAASAAALTSQDNGGNQSQHSVPEAFADFRERMGVEEDLREALSNGTLTVHYQPVVDITAGGRVVGAEALVRWPRGDQSVVGPDRFIPMAEETGLIHELGLQVFDTACRDLAAWQKQGLDLWVSVNLSPLQLDDPHLPDVLAKRARAAGVDCSRLKLEITESALVTDVDLIAHALKKLRAAGFLLG